MVAYQGRGSGAGSHCDSQHLPSCVRRAHPHVLVDGNTRDLNDLANTLLFQQCQPLSAAGAGAGYVWVVRGAGRTLDSSERANMVNAISGTTVLRVLLEAVVDNGVDGGAARTW